MWTIADLNLYWDFARNFTKPAKSLIWQTPCSVSAVSYTAISQDGKTRFLCPNGKRRPSMNDRRRGERNILSQPGMGTVRVTQDVEVTRLDSTEAAVITTQTLPVGERVLLEIPDERSAISKARLFRTVKTRFVFKDGRLRREVQLSIIGHTGLPEARGTTEPIRPMTGPMIAAISRRVPVRLVEVSTSGCLCDAPAPLEEGSVGFVDVRTPGHHRTEAVRILRTHRAGGSSWPYRMAVEFLTLAPLSPDSLRGIAAVIATGAPSAQRP